MSRRSSVRVRGHSCFHCNLLKAKSQRNVAQAIPLANGFSSRANVTDEVAPAGQLEIKGRLPRRECRRGRRTAEGGEKRNARHDVQDEGVEQLESHNGVSGDASGS